ncbi:MAG TPA: hypothetical protein VJ779_13980 [Acetobacteraceae bacterium]|nr:hypothetical protein [Acetobacteraceae bacterium]
MWTKAQRARHGAALKKMVSTNEVEEMARRLEEADPPRSKCATPALPVVGAIARHPASGWELAGEAGEGSDGEAVGIVSERAAAWLPDVADGVWLVPPLKGFVVLAGRSDIAAARLAFAAVLSGVEALLNPMPIYVAAS